MNRRRFLTKAGLAAAVMDAPNVNDEILDVDHVEFARTCATDIPSPETDIGVVQ